MAAVGELRERRRRFVEAFLAEPNATKAAIAAGYSPGTAKQQGSRLLTKVDVREAIQERVRADPAIATREERQRFLSAMIRNPEVNPLARLKACDLLARSQGDYVERHEISGLNGQEPAPVIYLPSNARD